MRPRLLSTSLLDSSRFTQDPESLGQLAILTLERLDHLPTTHSKSYIDGYDKGSQDRQTSRAIWSRAFRSSRRPPCLERQDAFVETRTRKDRQIQIRNLVNDGETCSVRHQFKGAHTHGLVIINGIMVLQEEVMLPRWLDVGATQPLGKRRRGLIPENFADECEVKKKKRSGVRNRGNPEQSFGLGSACDAAENSN